MFSASKISEFQVSFLPKNHRGLTDMWCVQAQLFKFFLSIKGGFLKYFMQQLKTSIQRFDATNLANFGKSDAEARYFDL